MSEHLGEYSSYMNPSPEDQKRSLNIGNIVNESTNNYQNSKYHLLLPDPKYNINQTIPNIKQNASNSMIMRLPQNEVYL